METQTGFAPVLLYITCNGLSVISFTTVKLHTRQLEDNFVNVNYVWIFFLFF